MRIERVVGSTEADWVARLPAALGAYPWRLSDNAASIVVGEGSLRIAWQAGEPMAIGLVRMPRLHVAFDFDDVSAAERAAFLARFDLYMHRGGG